MTPKAPSYSGRPIGSVEALARALGVETKRLLQTTNRADRLYARRIPIRKKNKVRYVYPAKPELRDLQQRFADRVLRHVFLPPYLMGGIPGRSYIGNARHHSGSDLLIGEDIQSFYPSISVGKVKMIFMDILRLPPEVALLLARLCCRRGELVQGGVASTLVANLALYRTEPEFAQFADSEQLRYTRFVDDVHVSSVRPRSRGFATSLVKCMRAMLERAGFQPKREKQFVARPGAPMQVHGLNVNSTASSPRRRRQSLSNEMFLLERWAAMQQWDGALERTYRRLCSKVGQLKALNPGEWRRLRRRLERLGSYRIRHLYVSLDV